MGFGAQSVGGGGVTQEEVNTSVIDVKSNSATKTDIYSSSSTGSWLDVTDMTVSVSGLDAAKTYTLIAMANGHGENGSSQFTQWQLDINGNSRGSSRSPSSSQATVTLNGSVTGQTGSTSYTAKLQMKIAGGTGYFNNNTSHTACITLMVVEE